MADAGLRGARLQGRFAPACLAPPAAANQSCAGRGPEVSDIARIVILGAGQAGGEAAQRLRTGGFKGELTLIGEEPYPPYQRPPLSKKYLSGEMDLEHLLLRPPALYEEENIAVLKGVRAVWVDRTTRRVRLEGGRELPYDALILATGARARKLPVAGADLGGVFVLRTIADVDAIQKQFQPGAKLAVIGAGFIGLEAAAIGRKMGLDVTVIEAAARPLARVVSPETAGFYLDEHAAHGVRFALSAMPVIIKGAERVRAVGMSDGAEIAADIVIAGIGITPETSLAQHAGLHVDDGIIVDRAARTSDHAIYAIGDCAKRPVHHYRDRLCRLESVHNAIEGAKVVAATILGQEPPHEEAPWFWSDQYDLKLQIAGLFSGYDRIVRRGELKDRAFAHFYFAGERLIAVDAVNKPGEYLGAKRLIEKDLKVSPETLADNSVPMKTIVANAGS
ncbi:MAG: FAD-dependent oxidoreductase [Hyphomonadaceae bacterium]|nr:FAD-dependent oxidoreductase [Hyphomonadaceae bacterium]